MGPFIEYLISFYGLPGSLLILCGLALNGVVFGLLIPAEPPEQIHVEEQLSDQHTETAAVPYKAVVNKTCTNMKSYETFPEEIPQDDNDRDEQCCLKTF